MKLITKILIYIITLISIINKSNEVKTRKNHKKDIKAYPGDPSLIIASEAGYKSPIITSDISSINDPESKKETANAHISKEIYYNGKDNLNVQKIECAKLSKSPTKCISDKLCGWCKSDNTCIPGTPEGPLTECKGIYSFSDPNVKITPLNASNINIYTLDKNKNPIYKKTYQPDLDKVNVSPYL